LIRNEERYFTITTLGSLYSRLLLVLSNITFIQGLSLGKITSLENFDGCSNVIITDDLMDQAVNNTDFMNLFTVLTHHKNLLNIFISQNIFLKGRISVTLNRNVHYYFLFRTAHLSTMNVLSNQLYGEGTIVKEAFLKAMNDKEYGYLLIDIYTKNIENRLRSCILKEEMPLIIWRKI